MKISIVGSLDFAQEMKDVGEKLEKMGFEVDLPPTAKMILKEEITSEQIKKEKEGGSFSQRVIDSDAIRRYWKIIQNTDAILVVNFDKKGTKGYVGGNSFLEMGFAHVMNKKIFLMNPIPEMGYKDEIEAMQPIILNSDVSKII
ncbi:MAG TPA: hypothetical protein P5230_02305 [Candidatus Magasanikbacteria bacterium]|nr:hypothetical protein [Candidatus Magasanikbacteria bacterium]